ncbi:hypothetical protein SDC9_154979 [bioreactor metagenome]|uniref:Uncharacterized protein n=1 Tax=bioreactor metagenome TaxID=1076179 RepID=A0A645F083_9ZZZZ
MHQKVIRLAIDKKRGYAAMPPHFRNRRRRLPGIGDRDLWLIGPAVAGKAEARRFKADFVFARHHEGVDRQRHGQRLGRRLAVDHPERALPEFAAVPAEHDFAGDIGCRPGRPVGKLEAEFVMFARRQRGRNRRCGQLQAGSGAMHDIGHRPPVAAGRTAEFDRLLPGTVVEFQRFPVA